MQNIEKTAPGNGVKFFKTWWSLGFVPEQEDLHLAVLSISNRSGVGCFTLRGLLEAGGANTAPGTEDVIQQR